MSETAKSSSAKDSQVMSAIKARFGQTPTLIHTHSNFGDDTAVVAAADILVVMKALKEDPVFDFDIFLDATVVDYLGNYDLYPYLKELKTRYEVVYHLYSVSKNHRIRIKAPLSEDELQINSVTNLWVGADWMEREAYDLYGVIFRGHPNLKRILLYEEFEGHPLRKDYEKTKRQPLIGPKN